MQKSCKARGSTGCADGLLMCHSISCRRSQPMAQAADSSGFSASVLGQTGCHKKAKESAALACLKRQAGNSLEEKYGQPRALGHACPSLSPRELSAFMMCLTQHCRCCWPQPQIDMCRGECAVLSLRCMLNISACTSAQQATF